MKRTLFLALAATAISLVSCSKDDSYTPSKIVVQEFPDDPTDSGDVSRPPKGSSEKPVHVQAP